MQTPITTSSQSRAGAISRFMTRVYGWMTFGLFITAVVGYVIAYSPSLEGMFLGSRAFVGIALIAQFGLVIALSAGIRRMSVGLATFFFLLYSFMSGLTFSIYFLAYSLDSMGSVFAVTAGSFACLALFGYTTKKDLSSMGTFLVMGLFGVIIASIVNIFVHSASLDFALTVLCVGIFAGLTAWDTQKMKSLALAADPDSDASHKMAIIGALSLYLDFINLFIALLRIMGNRRR